MSGKPTNKSLRTYQAPGIRLFSLRLSVCFAAFTALTGFIASAPFEFAQAANTGSTTGQTPSCIGKIISHARFDNLEYLDADGNVVQTLQKKTQSGDLNLTVAQCDETYYVAVLPSGRAVMIKQADVVLIDPICDGLVVRPSNEKPSAGNGLGGPGCKKK